MPMHHPIGQFGRLGDVHGRSGAYNSRLLGKASTADFPNACSILRKLALTLPLFIARAHANWRPYAVRLRFSQKGSTQSSIVLQAAPSLGRCVERALLAAC